MRLQTLVAFRYAIALTSMLGYIVLMEKDDILQAFDVGLVTCIKDELTILGFDILHVFCAPHAHDQILSEVDNLFPWKSYTCIIIL
jgi:hypothetical protein